MKLLFLLLLGTALGLWEDVPPAAGLDQPRRRLEHDYKDRTACQYLDDFEGDSRDSCELLEDRINFGKAVEHARNVIGGCPVEGEPQSVILIRDDQSWVFTTRSPKSAYTPMIKFLRQQSEEVHNDHVLRITYKYRTRMGERTLLVKSNMDLYAATLLQQDHHSVELYVELMSETPTAVPTTATPTAVPTTPAPTKAIISKILSPTDDVPWLNGMIKRLNLKMRPEPCYVMSTMGKNQATFRKNCGNGKGGFMFVVKATTGHVMGAFNDLNWTDTGGSYFQCRECFLWILKGRTYTKKRMDIYRNNGNASYHHTSYGPCFGGGHDLCINSPSSPSGYANTGHTYRAPNGGYPYYVFQSSGSGFSITEWEVFPAVAINDWDFYTRLVPQSGDRKWINSLLPEGKKMGQRCYSMYYGLGHTSKSTSYFRNSCAEQGPIMVTMKVGSYVFGGYSAMTWSKSSVGYKSTNESFLYILKDRKYAKKKLGVYKNQNNAVYMNTSYGPCFGGGHDMCISSPGSPSGYGKIGHTYEAPDGSSQYFMTSSSSQSWTLSDWEVHIVVDED